MIIPIRIDVRGLVEKQKAIMRELDEADARAQRDAAKQTRTAASRIVRKTLDLPKMQADRDINFLYIGNGRWEFRAGYRLTPAHRFRSFRANNRQAPGKSKYLRVRFTRSKPMLYFRRGFTIWSEGDTPTLIGIQRKGRTRYPTEPILGPTPYSVLVEHEQELRRIGLQAYERRSAYHKSRVLARVS